MIMTHPSAKAIFKFFEHGGEKTEFVGTDVGNQPQSDFKSKLLQNAEKGKWIRIERESYNQNILDLPDSSMEKLMRVGLPRFIYEMTFKKCDLPR
jgi:23S rRNA A1618 N6-methylase RlmF